MDSLIPLSESDAILVAALVAGIFGLLVGLPLRRLAVREATARHAISFNVSVEASVRREAAGKALLETRVRVVNNSNDRWALPLLYTCARGIAPTPNGAAAPITRDSFDALPAIGVASEIRNLASVRNSVFQIGPGETECFARWDWIEPPNLERFPFLMVKVDLFGTPASLLGESHKGRWGANSKWGPGSKRTAWVRLMEEEDGIRNRAVFTRRCGHSPIIGPALLNEKERERCQWAGIDPGSVANGSLRPTERYFVFPGTQSVDVDWIATVAFRDVLGGMGEWTRFVVVGADNEASHESRK